MPLLTDEGDDKPPDGAKYEYQQVRQTRKKLDVCLDSCSASSEFAASPPTQYTDSSVKMAGRIRRVSGTTDGGLDGCEYVSSPG